MAEIVIIGGHGKIARRLASLLSARHDTVRAVVRNPDHADDVARTGAHAVVADIEHLDAPGFAAVLSGADAVVFSAGAGGGNPERTYAVDRDAAIRAAEGARMAGVQRFVLVSYLGANVDHGVPESDPFFAYAEAKAAADAALRTTDLDWTILMPGRLTDDEPSGSIDPAATRAPDNSGTSRGNVALVAAAVLAEPATIGRDLPFTDGTVPIAEAIAAQP